MLAKRFSQLHKDFTDLNKMSKLAFLFNILKLDKDHRKGFQRLYKKSKNIWLNNQICWT